jgi:DNA-binding transcriptional ArsR family regulator
MDHNTPINLLPLNALTTAADCLRILAHPIRLRIVDILLQGEFPVHQIAQWCAIEPSQTSEHLRLMQGHQLLTSARRGRTVYYRILSENLPGILDCIKKNCSPDQNLPLVPQNQIASDLHT